MNIKNTVNYENTDVSIKYDKTKYNIKKQEIDDGKSNNSLFIFIISI